MLNNNMSDKTSVFCKILEAIITLIGVLLICREIRSLNANQSNISSSEIDLPTESPAPIRRGRI
jgi:hypothetical protein